MTVEIIKNVFGLITLDTTEPLVILFVNLTTDFTIWIWNAVGLG